MWPWDSRGRSKVSWQSGLNAAFLSPCIWVTTKAQGDGSSLLIQLVVRIHPPQALLWYSDASLGILPAPGHQETQLSGRPGNHPKAMSPCWGMPHLPKVWAILLGLFPVVNIQVGVSKQENAQGPGWALWEVLNHLPRGSSLLPLSPPLSPPPTPPSSFFSLAFDCYFLWRKKLFCPRKLIYSEMSERSGHLAPRGACSRVIALALFHLALWSLGHLPANITPGFNWKGKDSDFHLLGFFVIVGAKVWPGLRWGVGMPENWIWKMSGRPGKRKLPSALECLPLLAGTGLTCSQTNLANPLVLGSLLILDAREKAFLGLWRWGILSELA